MRYTEAQQFFPLGFGVSSSPFFQAKFWPLGQVSKIQGNLLYAINEM